MKKRILVLLAALALLVTCAVFAVAADGAETPSREPDAPGVNLAGTETCPVCSKTLAEITAGGEGITPWVEVTAENAATADWNAEHIWIKEDITLPAANIWANASQVVLIRATNDFTAVPETSVVVTTTAGQISANVSTAMLSIYGDNATIASSLTTTSGGMFNMKAALVIKGDVTLTTTGTPSKPSEGGFVYIAKATGTFEGVTFDGGYANNGGAVCIGSTNTNTTFTDCVFKDCTTTAKGGAIMAYGSTATMTDVDFYNCSSVNGGAIYGYFVGYLNSGKSTVARPTINMTDCSISDCTASTAGGAAYLFAGYLKLDNSPVSYCSAPNGGAFYTNVGSYKHASASNTAYAMVRLEVLNKSHISHCSATNGKGGVLYVSQNFDANYPAKFTDVNITDCSATSSGGVLYIAASKANAIVFVTGASVIERCYAGTNGGVVMMESGRFELRDSAQLKVDATKGYANSKGVRLTGGWMRIRDTAKIITTGSGRGQGIYALNIKGTEESPVYIILAQGGSVVGPNGEHDGGIYVGEHEDGKFSQLRIQEDWYGEASVALCTSATNNYTATNIALTPGETVPNTNILKVQVYDETAKAWVDSEKEVSFTGKLFVEDSNAGNPQLYGEAGLARVARTQLDVDGTKTWYKTNADAVAAFAALGEDAKATAYLRPWTTEALDIADNVAHVNFGKGVPETITVGENGQLFAIDTTTALGGKNVIPTDAVSNDGYYKFGTREYIVKVDETAGTTAIYPIQYKMSTVSLRAANQAVYYTATIKAHEDLNATAGVAVTIAETPAEEINAEYLCTVGKNTTDEYTGVMISNIMGTGDDKAARAAKPIHARAYITIDGETYVSGIKSFSLVDVVNTVITGQYDKLNATQLKQFNALHAAMVDAGVEALEALPAPKVEE